MKKITVLLILCTAMLFTACVDESERSPGGEFTSTDLYLLIDDVKYRTDVYIDEIIEAFGEDYYYSEAISCAYDGLDKFFDFTERGLTFYTRPDGDRDIVIEIYAKSTSNAVTSKGVTFGTTRDEVIGWYGEPAKSSSLLHAYELSAKNSESEGASLYFEFAPNDTVSIIAITAEQLIGE